MQKNTKLVIIIICILAAAIIFGYFLLVYLPADNNLNSPTDFPTLEKAEITQPVKQPVVISPNKNEEYTVLRVKKNDGSYEILTKSSIPSEYYILNNRLASWGDYVFFEGAGDHLIYSYNFKINKKDVILDLSQEYENLEGNRAVRLDHLLIYNKTLYIILGEYMTEGGLFSLDLPPQGIAKAISKDSSPDLVKLNNLLWVRSGFGDACVSTTRLSYFDQNTKILGPTIDDNYDCGDGTMFIGITSDNQFISAAFKNFRKSNDDTEPESFCRSISQIDSKTVVAKVLISEELMPSRILEVKFSPLANEILLKGQKNYLFKIADKKLLEVTDQKIIERPDFMSGIGFSELVTEAQPLPPELELSTQKVVAE